MARETERKWMRMNRTEREAQRHKTRERKRVSGTRITTPSQSVMKPMHGFGPGDPRCRSSPHSHRRLLLGHPVMHPFDQYCLRGIDARALFSIVRPARRTHEQTDRRTRGRLVAWLVGGWLVGPRLVRPAPGNYPFPPSSYSSEKFRYFDTRSWSFDMYI